MPIMEWEESFNLGMDPFDAHHRHLVGLLNSAYDTFVSGPACAGMADVLDQLADYATYHFAAEEQWMKENGYPEAEEHEAQHERFNGRVQEIQQDLAAGRKNLSLEILSFLKGWLVQHILVSDAAYRSFAAKRQGVELIL